MGGRRAVRIAAALSALAALTVQGQAVASVRSVAAGVHVVIGTTGFDPAPLSEARPADPNRRANVLIAPNFAIVLSTVR